MQKPVLLCQKSQALRPRFGIQDAACGHDDSHLDGRRELGRGEGPLWESYAGYSDMAPLPRGDAAMIIMENGNKSCFSDFVSVAKITKAWLEGP